MSNIVTIAEHSVELSLLPEKANILDLGCRGFLFANALHNEKHNVVCVDCDFLHGNYHRYAISDYRGQTCLQRNNDPQATGIKPQRDKLGDTSEVIQVVTLQEFSEWIGITFFDLIKMDIEGSEYEVIMSLTEPPAKQMSIEFHLHTKIYGDKEVKQMEDKLISLGYYAAKHDKTQAHGMGFNYWDSLWILK